MLAELIEFDRGCFVCQSQSGSEQEASRGRRKGESTRKTQKLDFGYNHHKEYKKQIENGERRNSHNFAGQQNPSTVYKPTVGI